MLRIIVLRALHRIVSLATASIEAWDKARTLNGAGE
jgi:hypothetical protein